MQGISSIVERIQHWMSTGTANEVFVKKALVIAVAILIIYRLGYAVGELLFHIGS